MIRQPIISVLGHVDHGKCVTGDTEIALANGSIRPIKGIYDELSTKMPRVPDGRGDILDLSGADIKLLSLDETGAISARKASHIWRLKADKVVEVATRHGSRVKVTPEHPFFSMGGDGMITKVRADSLKTGDFILVPARVQPPQISLARFKELFLLKLAESRDFIAFFEPEMAARLGALAKEKKRALITRSVHDCTMHGRFRAADAVALARGKIPPQKLYDSITAIKYSTTKQRASHRGSLISLPKTEEQFKDAFYAMGALWGDGTRGNAILSNTDGDLIAEYGRAMMSAFGTGIRITPQRTTNSVANTGNKTFGELLCQVFAYPRRDKSRTMTIPDLVLRSPNPFLSAFISGYFDTDGYVSKSTGVEVLSMSGDMIRKLAIALQRFGCPSVVSSSRGGYRLKISGSEYLCNFSESIGFRLARKQACLDSMHKKATTSRIFDLLPIPGSKVRELRVSFGLSGMETEIPYQKAYEKYPFVSRAYLRSFIKSLQKRVLGKGYKGTMRERLSALKALERPLTYSALYKRLPVPHKRLLNHLTFLSSEGLLAKAESRFMLTAKGLSLLPGLESAARYPVLVFNHAGRLHGIVNSDFVCTRVAGAREIRGECNVYDFTQPETHNFIADRCIIHNTSFLDKIRESSVAAREAGGITQHIGATEVPIDVIKNLCGKQLEAMNVDVTIPGLLFIDTPGHEAFTNLRKRGGSIADLAVLVVDIREGFMPQTIEALEILKNYKTPFIVVANKIDLLSGWHNTGEYCFIKAVKQQQDFVRKEVEQKLYELVGRLSEMNISSERFDRVGDFTKQVCIVPVSAKTGEGIAEAMMLLTGLSQKYLEKNLQIEVKGPGKASILEVKEEKGLGTSLDLILYDGTIKRGDTVVMSGKDGPVETKVKALLKPKPLDEMRDPRDKFDNIASISAASGLKLVGPGVENALPGGQVYVVEGADPKKAEELKAIIRKELESVRFDHENVGLVVRSDSLGSLEAILGMFKKLGIPVRKADIGAVSKTDIMEAESMRKQNPEYGIVIAFNAPVAEDLLQYAETAKVKLLANKIIFKIIEDYGEWVKDVKRQQEMAIFDTIPFPAEIKFLEGCTFRRSDPAIIGVAVIKGRIREGYPLMKEDGTRVGTVKSIQDKTDKLDEAKKGMEVAVAIDGPLVGRNIVEGDILFTHITFNEYETILKKGKKFMNKEDEELLKKLVQLSREK